MNCPICKKPLREVKVVSHYGQPIILDQCSHCGGFWFDRYELYRIKKEELEKISVGDLLNKMITSHKKTEILFCPRDNTKLEKFNDLNFPKEIDIERCSRCKGFWFDLNDLNQYCEVRNKKFRDKLNSQTDKFSKLFEVFANNDIYISFEKLGEFLSLPINRATMLPESWGIGFPFGRGEATDPYTQEVKKTFFVGCHLLQTLIEVIASFLIRK